MQQIHRLPPAMSVNKYKTYSVASPIETHTRPGRCEEVECQAHTGGWQTPVDESSDIGVRQAAYIRTQSGRAHTETKEAGLTMFTFPAGQQCFAGHRVSLERPEIYVVRDGDWRGNPSRRQRVHTGPDAWLNDFGDHQNQLDKTINGK